MSFLCLDLSKRNTGWAQYRGEWDRPVFGSVPLGSEYSTDGAVFAKLFRELSAIHQLTPVTRIFLEKPFTAAHIQGNTSADTLRLLGGLATVVHMFAYHKGLSVPVEVNASTWRRNFIGPQKRGTKRPTLKKLVLERCHSFGWRPRNDDEGDALGLLDSVLLDQKIQTPWRAAETLQPMSEVAR